MNLPLNEPQRLEPPAILLFGPPGSGKTHALTTFVKAGIELFVLSTEPRGVETLIDAARIENVDINKIHWSRVRSKSGGIASLQKLSQLVNVSSYDALTKLGGIEKSANQQYLQFLEQIANFKDERTGQAYGDVTSWGPDRCFALDSLSGLNDLIMSNTVGQKPAPSPGEWNVAQVQEMNLINLLAAELKCYFVLIAHIDRVEDEVTKQQRIVPSAIGSKLGPKIGKYFSEMVQTKRLASGEKATYVWSTLEQITDLKNRALPAGSSLTPSFIPLVDAYKKRLSTLK